jgi:hypothetical protein
MNEIKTNNQENLDVKNIFYSINENIFFNNNGKK